MAASRISSPLLRRMTPKKSNRRAPADLTTLPSLPRHGPDAVLDDSHRWRIESQLFQERLPQTRRMHYQCIRVAPHPPTENCVKAHTNQGSHCMRSDVVHRQHDLDPRSTTEHGQNRRGQYVELLQVHYGSLRRVTTGNALPALPLSTHVIPDSPHDPRKPRAVRFPGQLAGQNWQHGVAGRLKLGRQILAGYQGETPSFIRFCFLHQRSQQLLRIPSMPPAEVGVTMTTCLNFGIIGLCVGFSRSPEPARRLRP